MKEGEALPYRENTGITEDEYKTLLDSLSNMKMVNEKNISIKVTRDKDKLTFKSEWNEFL
ncbi:hypothetical protein [Priestia endophytica]|uniref:hypothetical protein n=1 Tax=Priestia endophytica TaxID=135735 RepID=UPI000DCA5939|nr:hypothetical protein [Priestia endophytica]RAS75153.1 hypothetical protein A4R27_22750 [Priestia endophytica]